MEVLGDGGMALRADRLDDVAVRVGVHRALQRAVDAAAAARERLRARAERHILSGRTLATVVVAAHFLPVGTSDVRAAMKASCGTSTDPMDFMRFLPSFCFSSSLRLRVMSPP